MPLPLPPASPTNPIVFVGDQASLDTALAAKGTTTIWVDATAVLNADTTGRHTVVVCGDTRLRAAGDSRVIVADNAAVFLVESGTCRISSECHGQYRNYDGRYTTVRALPLLDAGYPPHEGWTAAPSGTLVSHFAAVEHEGT